MGECTGGGGPNPPSVKILEQAKVEFKDGQWVILSESGIDTWYPLPDKKDKIRNYPSDGDRKDT